MGVNFYAQVLRDKINHVQVRNVRMYSFYQSCKLHGVNFEKYMKKALAIMTMNMDKIIFEKNKNGTITGFKSHRIPNDVLDEFMPWNENFKK